MLDTIYDKISAFIIRRSRLIIAAVLILTAAGAAFITQLHFENDMTFWVEKDGRIGRLPYYVNSRFGSNTPLLIAVDCGDVFTPDIMRRLEEFTREMENLPSVEDQVSLASVDNVTSTEDGIVVEKLLPSPLPGDAAFFAGLREKVLSNKEYAGRIVSRDGSVAFIAVRPKFGERSDYVGREVKAIAKRIFEPAGASLYFSGNPYLLDSMSGIVLSDFVFLIPLVSLLVVGILFLSFRTVRGVALPLVTVLISTALAMGVMAALHVPLNILSSALPVILIAVGSAYGIHVLNNYYENAGTRRDPKEIVRLGIREVGLPVLMAGLTTIAGFISNATTEVTVIKTFGIFTAVGVTLAMLIALLFIPAVLLHMKVPARKMKSVIPGESEETRTGKLAKAVSRFCLKHKYAVIAAFGLAGIGIFLFSFKIESKVDILGYFGQNSEPNVAARFVSSRFGGFSPLSVFMKADMQDPEVLKLSLMLEEKMKAYGNLSEPTGMPDIICELNDAMTGIPSVPETKKEVQELWFFVEGRKTIDSMVTKEKDEGLVTVYLPGFDNVYVSGLTKNLEDFIAGYRGGFAAAPNAPDNPQLAELEKIMISNVLRRYGQSASPADKEAAVGSLAQAFAATHALPDRESLIDYCTGDEAEILLTRAESLELYGSLRKSGVASPDGVRNALRAVLRGRGAEEDVDALARSIVTLAEDADRTAKMDALSASLVSAFPALAKAPESEIRYVLAPFLWKTIPAPAGAASAEARRVDLPDVQLTGSAYLIQEISNSIFKNQISSIAVALGAVLILNCLTFGSLVEGLISLCSILFTIMVNFGIMGIFRIPLDFVTAIIASVAIGTGIDYTIHFITRYTREMKDNGGDMQAAYERTLSTTGKAIVFNALSVGLGFAVLLFSNVIPMRTAGLLLAVTMLTSSLSAMTFLPAVLCATRIVQKKTAGRVKARAGS